MEARLIISEVELLNGAISIGKPNPINNGPITLASPKVFIILYEMAALCCPGIIRILAFPTIFENGTRKKKKKLKYKNLNLM